jgi:hypothetical protein
MNAPTNPPPLQNGKGNETMQDWDQGCLCFVTFSHHFDPNDP